MQAGVLIRTFICIKIPDDHRKILAGWIDSRRRELHEVRWTDPDIMHITLKFCGEILPDTLSLLADNLQLIKQKGPFSISIDGIGGFPDLAKPRVIWTGIEGDIPRLKELQRNVENAAYRAGIPKEERPYSPHITLGRRNSTMPIPDSAKKAMESDVLMLEQWTVEEMFIMRSILSSSGPRYTPLGLFKI